MPLAFSPYDPRDRSLRDLGKCSLSDGEAYSMANLDGKLYICSYPAARLSVYDPNLPYHFDPAEHDNPRDVGRMDEISYRPRSMLTGPLGRAWIASVPDYGMWGGPLSWYDPSTGRRGSYHRTWGDGSCHTLAHLERQRLIATGTSVHGGSGTQPRVEQAALRSREKPRNGDISTSCADLRDRSTRTRME